MYFIVIEVKKVTLSDILLDFIRINENPKKFNAFVANAGGLPWMTTLKVRLTDE